MIPISATTQTQQVACKVWMAMMSIRLGVTGTVQTHRSHSTSIDGDTSAAPAAEEELVGGTHELISFGKKRQNPISLRNLLETGQGLILDPSSHRTSDETPHERAKKQEMVGIQVAAFLHRELPIRLAHRVVELESSELFMKSSHIRKVCSWYKTSFAELRQCPAPVNKEKERYFAKAIEAIYERHSGTLMTMAKGAHQIRQMLGQDVNGFADHTELQSTLDDFYMSRIRIRTLIGQYLALRKTDPKEYMIGQISQKASPFKIAGRAIADSAYMCRRHYGDAPNVTIHGRTDLTFPYIPSYMSYILVELLKNSMRATVEKHGVEKMPQIRIVIADGEDNEDVVIKVSDEGGGIRRSNMNRIWSYNYTTANPQVIDKLLTSDSGLRDFDTASPLAGLGYGLPIARNYARSFGGDLTMMSMEGYGTDGYIHLPRLHERGSTAKLI